jgi:hypothetical protein
MILPMAALLALAACGSSKELTCASDQKVCSNACVSVLTDSANCGACGHTCGTGQGCSAGACVDCSANPAACTAEVVVACFATDDVRFVAQDLTQVGPSLAVGTGPASLASISGTFFVANDLASTITPFTLAPLSASTAIDVPFTGALGDLSTLAAHGGLLWASNDQANTLVVVDPAAARVIAELPLAQTQGERVNPKGIDFDGNKAYLALYDAGAVAVLDVTTPSAPKVLKRIDVSKYATSPANASPSNVLAANGKIHVTLANIQDATFTQVAGAHGKLVVIDPSTDTVVGDTALDLGPDCLDASALVLSGTTLWVGCGYNDLFVTHSVLGGGLMPVSLAGSTPQAGSVVKSASGIDALAVCGGKGYAGASESGKVLQFDPATGSFLASADICPIKGYAFVADLACVR